MSWCLLMVEEEGVFVTSSQRAVSREVERVTRHSNWPRTDPVWGVLNTSHPKKHLSPGQTRIVVHPQTNNNITDLSESKLDREPRQALHLCEQLVPLLYTFGEFPG